MITRRALIWSGSFLAAGASAYAQAGHGEHSLLAQNSTSTAPAGEGEGSAQITTDADFIHSLGLVEGHMTVGTELYAMGDVPQALTHMKHPQDEIYAALLPELRKRKAVGFEIELAAVAEAVERHFSAQDVRKRMDALVKALDANGRPQSAKMRLQAASMLVRTAASEYAQGVKDGEVVNPHEYQDAYGFVQVAKRLVATLLDEERRGSTSQFVTASRILAELDKAWPDLAGNMKVSVDSTDLAAAAARLEIEALSIR